MVDLMREKQLSPPFPVTCCSPNHCQTLPLPHLLWLILPPHGHSDDQGFGNCFPEALASVKQKQTNPTYLTNLA